MKKILLTLTLCLVWSSLLHAGPTLDPILESNTTQPGSYFTGPGNTGDYIPYSLVHHGDNEPFPSWMIGDVELYALFKWEIQDGGGWVLEDGQGGASAFTMTGTPGTKGTWSYDGSAVGTPPGKPISAQNPLAGAGEDDFQLYFSIKAGAGNPQSGGGYNLFLMKEDWDINQAVTWSTLNDFFNSSSVLDDLNGRDLSHIAFWKQTISETPPGSQIPEPASVILLGLGLLGSSWIGRRRNS